MRAQGRGWAFVVLGLCASAGCDRRVFLQTPGTANAKSVIVVIDPQNPTLIAAEPGQALSLPELSSTDSEDYLYLAFSKGLAELGLSAGTLSPAPDPATRLPKPALAYRTSASKGSVEPWTEIAPSTYDAMVPAAVRDFRVPDLDHCTDFSSHDVGLRSLNDPHFLLPIDASRAIASFDSSLFFIDREGAVVETPLVSPLRGAAFDDAGTLWAIGPAGYAKIAFDPLVVSPVGPGLPRARWIAPTSDPTGLGTYALGDDGVVWLNEGGRWARSATISYSGPDVTDGGLTRAAPDRVYVGVGDNNEILEIRRGVAARVVLDELGFGYTVASTIPGFGPTLVTKATGVVYRWDGERMGKWATAMMSNARGAAPYGSSILLGSTDGGTLLELRPGRRCPAFVAAPLTDVQGIATLGDRVLVFGKTGEIGLALLVPE